MSNEIEQSLRPEEIEQLQSRLWTLLTRQAALYTPDTSLPEGIVRDLLASVRFSLEWYLEATGQSVRTLLTGDLEGVQRQAETLLKRQVVIAGQRYQTVKVTAPIEASQSMEDTINGLGVFFRRYDTRYFSNQVPCDIDYPLCLPMPEERLGVLYIREYLERLLIENAFLSHFSREAILRVLTASLPFDRQMSINLYEPVASAALGLTLTDGDLYSLDITVAGQAQLTESLQAMTPTARRDALHRAAKMLARRMALSNSAAAYLASVDLAPRVDAVLSCGRDWQGLFPAFS